ncbi:MAG: hypothetical protein EX285_08660 [Thaumarchaeota archaeon]|nr:hypothetical protein [Nitrososphaerota archaeon]
MRTVSSKVSKREHAAIVKYANQTGESVSNLIRKVVISESVYGDSGEIPAEYHLDRYSADVKKEARDEALEGQIKEIKVSLGREQIGKEKPTLLINEIANRIREESKLIKSDAEDFSG